MNLYDPALRTVTIDADPVERYVEIKGVPDGLEHLEFIRLKTNGPGIMYAAMVFEIDHEQDVFWLTFDKQNPLWC